MGLNYPTRLEVKPLSVNECRTISRGKKIKTKKYKEYERLIVAELLYRKVKIDLPEEGELYIFIKIGVSKSFDLDNCVKPFVDILQRIYKFNDNRLTIINLEKVVVKRGSEFISFQLSPRFVYGRSEKESKFYDKQ